MNVRMILRVALLATLLGGCHRQAEPDRLTTGPHVDSSHVVPARLGVYQKLGQCETQVAALLGRPVPDSPADRQRRAYSANAGDGALKACEAQQKRLDHAGGSAAAPA